MEKNNVKILACLFIGYVFLVATHEGEFWPFSIYPMFSQAGRPWNKFMIREFPDSLKNINWDKTPEKQLPDNVYAVNKLNLNQNDFSAFMVKWKTKQSDQKKSINNLLKHKIKDEKLLILQVQGRLSEKKSDSVVVLYRPVIFFSRDTVIINPTL